MKMPSKKRSQRSRSRKQKRRLTKVTITPGTGARRIHGDMTVDDLPTSADIVRGTTDHRIGVTYETGVPKPISIVPTIYPQNPDGSITVQNFITINTHSTDFRAFEDTMGQLLAEMRKSNEIAGEVRDKLVAEIKAGMTILNSPKPDRRVIDVWLIRPLKYILDKAAGTVIGKLAGSALELLIKMIG